MTPQRPFWQRLGLSEMTQTQWESLCDGCARCCLIKLEDEDSGEIAYTRVACHLLDQDACRCTRYPKRHELVPDCVHLGPEQAEAFRWLPTTCAYRILAEGGDLPEWHPLVSGDPQSVHRAGISIRGRALSEAHVHPDGLDEHVIRWVSF
ncbi:MAG: YcgN family cysteine cluster protein [Gammaproteobacteria bacterium]|nr:YcgN family cysteine cluster protein [Gammaproteobacteria bacterium]